MATPREIGRSTTPSDLAGRGAGSQSLGPTLCDRGSSDARSVPLPCDFQSHQASRPAPARLATVRGMGRRGVRVHRPERGRGPVPAAARGPLDLAAVGPGRDPARGCDDHIRGDLVLKAANGPDETSGPSRIGACMRGLRIRPQRNGGYGLVPGMRSAIRHRRRSAFVGAGADAVACQRPTVGRFARDSSVTRGLRSLQLLVGGNFMRCENAGLRLARARAPQESRRAMRPRRVPCIGRTCICGERIF